jgi:hypothetical protein
MISNDLKMDLLLVITWQDSWALSTQEEGRVSNVYSLVNPLPVLQSSVLKTLTVTESVSTPAEHEVSL